LILGAGVSVGMIATHWRFDRAQSYGGRRALRDECAHPELGSTSAFSKSGRNLLSNGPRRRRRVDGTFGRRRQGAYWKAGSSHLSCSGRLITGLAYDHAGGLVVRLSVLTVPDRSPARCLVSACSWLATPRLSPAIAAGSPPMVVSGRRAPRLPRERQSSLKCSCSL